MTDRGSNAAGLLALCAAATLALSAAAPGAAKAAPPSSMAAASATKAAAPAGAGSSGAAPTALPTEASATPGPRKGLHYIDGVPDTGQFLPDSTVLARVDDREFRVGEYLESYFTSYAEDRPKSDSTGRIEFLEAMINKEVLGRTARAAGIAFGFEDRATMREHSQRVLSNTLYQRAVVDSSVPSEAEIQHVYDQCHYSQHLRHIQFADRATAERVRHDLLAGRIAWKDAVKKYTIATKDHGPDGDLGWTVRVALSYAAAEAVYSLSPNEISQVYEDEEGFHLVQAVARGPASPPALETIRKTIVEGLAKVHAVERARRLQEILSVEIGLAFDSANVGWASRQFEPAHTAKQENKGTSIEINPNVPEFQPADTARIVATYRDGRFTLGNFLDAYTQIQPLVRPSVNEPESFREQVRNFILEPYMAVVAVQRGLDKDPLTVSQIELKREQIMVEHMYQDSVASKVVILPAERHKFYADQRAQFVTFPSVRFAAFFAPTKGNADSLAARLRKGEHAEDILLADSLRGLKRGSIQERKQNEHGPFHKVLFEEMRPGQVNAEGPDKDGGFVVLQLIKYDVGRQLPYDEVQGLVDESLQNIKAEQVLKRLIARHRKMHRIESHPELVMRIRLVDPSL